MKMMTTKVFGKSIVAGEHAVLRGCPALVFPVLSKSLVFSYQDGGSGPAAVGGEAPAANFNASFTASFHGEHGYELKALFQIVLERALDLAKRSISEVRGHFHLDNSIPLGAGLGASAALCVAVGRWFQWKNWLTEPELAEFCRLLENLFHGESSGVDIAVAISGTPLHFQRRTEQSKIVLEPLKAQWKPNWYLSYSGQRGITADCIGVVKTLWARNEELGKKIDVEMKEAVLGAETALGRPQSASSFAQLAASLTKARGCFEQWGLVEGVVGEHLKMLDHHGAVAAKPTGSGGGGFILSLWRDPAPASIGDTVLTAI